MNYHCQIRRTTLPCPDAHQRWDRAYHSILQWTLQTDLHRSEDLSSNVNPKEEYHASSGIRPGLKLPTGQAPDD